MSIDPIVQPTNNFKKHFKSMLFNENAAFIPTLLVSCILLIVLYMMYLQGYSQRKPDKIDYDKYFTKNIILPSNINNLSNNYSKVIPPLILPLKRPEIPVININSQVVANIQDSLTVKASDANTLKQGCNTLIKAAIQFEPRTNYLNSTSKQNLDALVSCFKEHKVTISGHTDAIGTIARKAEVSQLRAATVQQYLIERGVPSTQLTTVGMSDSQPIADNGTAEGRSKNRRIEFMVESLAQ